MGLFFASRNTQTNENIVTPRGGNLRRQANLLSQSVSIVRKTIEKMWTETEWVPISNGGEHA